MLAARQIMWGGGEKHTAADYVQSGLLAMWDGIENAGWGVHDNTLQSWKDLSPNGRNLTKSSSATTLQWSDAGLSLPGNNTGNGVLYVASSAFASSIRVIEVVCDVANRGSKQCVCNVGTGVSAGVGITAAGYLAASGKTANSLGVGRRQAAWVYPGAITSAPSAVYVGGREAEMVTGNMSVGGSYYTNRFLLGMGYSSSFKYKGVIYALRLYNRALTADEVAANYAIDKERFGL